MQRLKIDHLSARGRAVALLEGGARVEVTGALSGEEVLVSLGTKKRRGTRKGFLQEVVTSSSDRVIPRCRHVPHCGGCLWQQMSYPAQLRTKQELVQNIFAGFSVQPIIACQNPWNYRNKMEFSFSQTAEKKSFLGLVLAGGNRRVLNIEECHLTSPWAIAALQEVRKWWMASSLAAYHHYRDSGHLRTLTIREAKRGKGKLVMLTVSGNPEYQITSKQIADFVEAIKQITPDREYLSIFLRVQQLLKGLPTQFYEMHLFGPDHFIEEMQINGRKLLCKISPTSFFQPNTIQAEILYSTALGMLKNLPQARVFDLYCGTATISLALALHAREVVGIEINPHAVMDAQCNKVLNQIDNLTVHCGDVATILERLRADCNFQHPDIVVVDPPRAGLDQKAVSQILSLRPDQILYLSCYPPTQAENIQALLQEGYSLEVLQPIDQFPHTPHVENIAHLVRMK